MCGRFTQGQEALHLGGSFGLPPATPALEPRYNIAPGQEVPIILADPQAGASRLEAMRWGLVPFWAKDPKIGYRTINARAETAATKPAFRAAFKARRCLVPADGFYEWSHQDKKARQAYWLHLKEGGPLVMAGLWESWRDPQAGDEAAPLNSFTILTTSANDLVAPIHDRMPVILDPALVGDWLAPGPLAQDLARRALAPFPASAMAARPVSSRVNSPRNQGPELLEEVEPARPGELF